MPADPSEGFDPYRAWLGVDEAHRPLTAYQLLRLEPFEDDVSTIRAAVGVQRMALECHRWEGSPEVWDQLHDELEEAVAALSDTDRKAAYDGALRRQEESERRQQGSAGLVAGKAASATIRCRQCGSASSATRRYCTDCGQSLWEPCLQCGTLSVAGERYCGACGASILGAFREEADRAEAAVREARRLRADAAYDQAIELLGPVSMLNHARLAEQSKEAGLLIRQIAEERDRGKAAAQEAYEAARRSADLHDDQAAVDRLEQVPKPLRTPEMERFLESRRERLEEIAALEAAIRANVTNGNSAGLPAAVRQLLVLKPDHALAQKLAGKLRNRCLRAAHAKLSEHQYAAALKLLEQVPPAAWTPEMEAVRQRTADALHLLGDLRNAPYVDEPLLGSATRLLQMAPDDPRAAKLHKEIERRAAIAAKDPRRGLAPWATPPERTHVGWPVDWLQDIRRVALKEEVARQFFSDYPGSLFVACGLALQGLGKGPVQTNLLPPDGRNFLGLVGQMLRRRSSHAAWGLDLSASGLKAVKLAVDGKQEPVAVTDCDVIEHSKPLNEAVNEDEGKLLVAETLKEFCLRHDVKADRVCVGLSGRLVLAREITVPLSDRHKMDLAVEYEARHHLPFRLSELAWGYETLDRPDARSGPERGVRVALVAAKRFQLKEHLTCFTRAGLPVDVVQSDCLALHNFLSHERGDGEEFADQSTGDDDLPVAVVDLGTDTTSVLISAPGMVWFRSTGFGAQNFNRALVRELKLTLSQAEAFKRDPSKAESPSKLHNAFEPVLKDLVTEIRASLETFGRSHGRPQIQRILGVGGGFRMHGLLRYLRSGR